VDVEWALLAECFVGSDRVEDAPVRLDLATELVTVVDLLAVQVLVLPRAEGALSDAVLPRRLSSRADVDQLRPSGDEGGEAGCLETGPRCR